jgi:hypothetical protein
MAIRRTYQPWKEKHKAPAGFGTHCPVDLTMDEAQDLLEKAIAGEDAGGEPKLYMVAHGWVFVAQATEPVKGIYHGYPCQGPRWSTASYAASSAAESSPTKRESVLSSRREFPADIIKGSKSCGFSGNLEIRPILRFGSG